MNIRKMITVLAILVLPALMLGGCKNEGPVEKAGSKVDQAIDNVKEGESPLKEKGPLEKAGESVDDALDTN